MHLNHLQQQQWNRQLS